MKTRKQKATFLLSSLSQMMLTEIQAGNMEPLSGRNAKQTRLFLNGLQQPQKTELFGRLNEGHLQTLVNFLSGLSDENLRTFIQTVDECWESDGKVSLSKRLFSQAA